MFVGGKKSKSKLAKMSKRSDIWNHFEAAVDGKARCKLCRMDIGYRGGCTSSLWKHVDNKHSHAVTPKLRSSAGVRSTGGSSYTVSGMLLNF